MKLSLAFYRRDPVHQIARDLLGKVLYTFVNGEITAGIIVETEAYSQEEMACHAYGGKITKRTEPMFMEGGISYIYLIYGMYELFNVVTGPAGRAEAVLIRALQPLENIRVMGKRRNMDTSKKEISSGPGRLSMAMGISRKLNGMPLTGDNIWIEDSGIIIDKSSVVNTKRIGVDYAGEDAILPWRFYLKENNWVSVF